MANLAMATEIVQINKTKYTKYSDAEIRTYITKTNSIRPDMTAAQVIAILGKPIREQSVSESPPQRILVFPLSIVVSFYFNRTSRTWLVTSPTLYGSPLCQREDGLPLKNSIGLEIIDYPGISCVPQKFDTSSSAKPKSPPVASWVSSAKWKLIHKGNRIDSDELYLDTSHIKTISPGTVEVAMLRSYGSPQTHEGPTFQSKAMRFVISCDNSTWGYRSAQNFSYEMARGRVTLNFDETPIESLKMTAMDPDSFPGMAAKEVCKSEAPNASEPLTLRLALADKNAITCRYNESENLCGNVEPAEFAAKAGYPRILKQQTFDEPGTGATYLKMTVKN
jgi:hypothetical protein